MGNILFILTRAKLKEAGDEVPSADVFPDTPLYSWKEEDWEALDSYMRKLTASMLREDADAPPIDDENPEVLQERAELALFTVRVEKIHRYIKLNELLSPVREKLMQQLEDEKVGDESYPKLDKNLIDTLW